MCTQKIKRRGAAVAMSALAIAILVGANWTHIRVHVYIQLQKVTQKYMSNSEYMPTYGYDALMRLGPKAGPALDGALRSRSDGTRMIAAAAYGSIGANEEQALVALKKALGDSNRVVRYRAADAMGTLSGNPTNIVRALIPAVEDRDEYVRLSAVDAIALFGPHAVEAVPALVGRLGADIDTGVARHASDALKRIGVSAKGAVPGLTKALSVDSPSSDQHFYSLVSAASALATIEPTNRAGIAILKQAAAGDYGYYCWVAGDALLDVRPALSNEAITALQRVVSSSNYPCRWEASVRLKGLGIE